MILTKEKQGVIAGIDFRKEIPQVCYQTGDRKEPAYLPLEYEKLSGHTACFCKILSALKRFEKKENIRAVLVLPDMEEETIRQYLQEACQAGFGKEQIHMVSEAESLVHFVMSQTSDIWQHRVFLLEFGQEEIRSICLHMNRRTSPMLVQAEEPEYWYVGNLLEGGRDEKLAETVKERFSGEPVSSVFLTGTDFNARDYKKSRDEICFRRRVFLAEQICARGACMLAEAGKDRVPYLFLSEQTLLYNVGIRSRRGGKESIYTLAEAGQNWYDIQVSQEMILVGSPVLELVFQPMLGGPEIRGGIRLQNLPERPEGTGRLLVEISFSSPKQCEVKVTDLGFGELYPASGLYWVDSFLLEEEEENHGTGGDLQEQTGEDTISSGTDRQKPV